MTMDALGLNFGEPNNNTIIEQSDKALHPEPKDGLMALILKTRIEPRLKPYIDHILSRAIQRGKFNIFGDEKGRTYNAAEAMVMADFLTSIALNGGGRKELIEMVSQIPQMRQRGEIPGFSGDGGSYKSELRN